MLAPLISRSPRREAFTLIELLVSMTVMALLVTLVTQLMNSATAVTSASTKRVDSDNQSRIVFNRMNYDFSGMILRKDVDCFFVKNDRTKGASTPNDAMYFFSESPGYFSNNSFLRDQSPVSMVGYRIANRVGTSSTAAQPDHSLERMARGLLFDGGAPGTDCMTFLAFPAPTANEPNPLPVDKTTLANSKGKYCGKAPTWDNTDTGTGALSSNTTNNVYPLSDAVFRMEFCFLVKDPTKGGSTANPKSYAVPLPPPGTSPWSSKPFMIDDYTGTNQMSMRAVTTDVAAVVVTIAALDTTSRVIVTPTQLAAARDALPDGDDATVAKTWLDLITDKTRNNTFRNATRLPQAAVSQIRVYQRFFYLNSK